MPFKIIRKQPQTRPRGVQAKYPHQRNFFGKYPPQLRRRQAPFQPSSEARREILGIFFRKFPGIFGNVRKFWALIMIQNKIQLNVSVTLIQLKQGKKRVFSGLRNTPPIPISQELWQNLPFYPHLYPPEIDVLGLV